LEGGKASNIEKLMLTIDSIIEKLNVRGKAVDKYVHQQGLMLKDMILKKIQENPGLAKEIYVITPFRNVAYQLIK